MAIALMGMSGCGKSFLAQRLVEEKGFVCLDCDQLIADRLTSTGLAGRTLRSVEDVAEWMGPPWGAEYRTQAAQYLELEAAVLDSALDEAAALNRRDSTVIDTTGSLVYLAPKVLERLKRETLLVYLHVVPEALDFLIEQYFREPKPVIWDSSFERLPGESGDAAIRRSYPMLLERRVREYQRWADVVIEVDPLSDKRPDPDSLLQDARRKQVAV